MKADKRPKKTQSRPQAAVEPLPQVASAPGTDGTPPTADALHHCIAVAAYFRAEQRGFMPGLELDDWLAAEAVVCSPCDQADSPGAAPPQADREH